MKATWFIITLTILFGAIAAPTVEAQTRYIDVMNTAAGRDTLLNLALWEDQRVTEDGKLFAYLAAKNPLVRWRTVQVIGRIQSPQDVSRLLPMLEDNDSRVVTAAIFALGQIGSQEAAPALVEFCKKAPRASVIVACEALGKIGGEEAVTFLMETLHDFNARVRGAAALALARAADESAIPALLIAIHDPDASVAWRAIYGLEKVEVDRVGDQVAEFLEHDVALVRAYTARTLGKQKHKKSVEMLMKTARDDDLGVAVNSIRALGLLEDDKPIHELGKILTSHRSHHARKEAAQSLGAIGDKKAQDHLIRAMLDRSVGVRVATIEALGKVLGEDSRIFVEQALNDGHRLVRAAAMETYGYCGEDVVDTIVETLNGDDDPMMRAAAARALVESEHDTAVPALIAALSKENDWVVLAEVCTALGELEAGDAASALIETYRTRTSREEGNVRLAVLGAFEHIDPSPAIGLLMDELENPDKRVRARCAKILESQQVEFEPLKPDRYFYELSYDRTRRRELAPPTGIRKAVISCDHGDIQIDLFGDDAAQTVASFVKLAGNGFYDGLTFHRVVPNFVVQGGCPRGDGWGDAGYYIRSEFNQHRYETGYVGIAHDGKDTGGSQFFINMSPQHHLDGRYTIFGKVTKGMDVVEKIDQGDEFSVKILQ